MNILAIDVDYDDDKKIGYVAGIMFTGDGTGDKKTYFSVAQNVAPYVFGEFYRRELPCIELLMTEHSLKPDIVIIDGYCDFSGVPCMGAILRDRHPELMVIGVAKNKHYDVSEDQLLYRGKVSKRPLYITTCGLSLDDGKALVMNLAGDSRMPDVLRDVDQACRKRVSDSSRVCADANLYVAARKLGFTMEFAGCDEAANKRG